MYGDIVPGDMILWELTQNRTAAAIVISVIAVHGPQMASKSDVSLTVIWMWDATGAHCGVEVLKLTYYKYLSDDLAKLVRV